MYSFSLVTAPAAEPVSLSEVKTYLRIATADDDTLLTALISAARQWAERYTGRAFITQTWQVALDSPPTDSNAVSLPRAPLQSVASVTYYSDNDAETVWAPSNYFVDTLREPGRLVLRIGATWPCSTRAANGIIITYAAGYGSNASSVPEPIRAAIRELVAYTYEHRGNEELLASARNNAGTVPPCFAAQALLNPYRVRNAGI